MPGKSRGPHKRYSLNGKTLTIAEWARELGVRDQAIRHRIKRGVPIDEAILTPVAKYHGRILFEGMDLTPPEWADHFGISREAMYARISRGWPKKPTREYARPVKEITIADVRPDEGNAKWRALEL